MPVDLSAFDIIINDPSSWIKDKYPIKGDSYERDRIRSLVNAGYPWCCASNWCEDPDEEIGFGGMCYCDTEDHKE